MLDEAIDLYDKGLNFSQIGAELGINRKVVSNRLNKLGYKRKPSFSITNKKYPLREDFFDVIDSEEKAYILGLLYADGCLKQERGICLGLIDLGILEKIRDIIYFCKRPIKKDRHLFMLSIWNKKLANRVQELGVIPRKTFKLVFPEWLDKSLYNHFIRGYFDGDGCISGHNFSIVGREEFLIKIRDILVSSCNLNKAKVYATKSVFGFSYGGYYNLKKIGFFLYSGATLFLERKHKKFEKFMKEYFFECIGCGKNVDAGLGKRKRYTCGAYACKRKYHKVWLSSRSADG